MIIDHRFKILAVNPINKKLYTEANTLVLPAGIFGTLDALDAYAEACIGVGAKENYLASVELLIHRAADFEHRRSVPETFDHRFKFLAINPQNGDHYTEKNAVLLCAEDEAAPFALRACVDILYCAGFEHKEDMQQILDRVVQFQAENGSKVPETSDDISHFVSDKDF